MMFIAIGVLTLLISILLYWRRAVEQRAIRWEMYKKRDELRRLAYENPALLHSDIFESLDKRITAHCATSDELSLWTILPSVFYADRRRIEGLQKNFETKLRQPRNAVMVPVYDGMVPLFARHLIWRHMFLTVLGAITILGIILCYTTTRWLSERILSDALRPITESRTRLAA